VGTENEVVAGIYPVYVRQSGEVDDTLIPQNVILTIDVPGAQEAMVFDFDITTAGMLNIGHVANIEIKEDQQVVLTSTVSSVHTQPRITQYSSSSGGGGGVSSYENFVYLIHSKLKQALLGPLSSASIELLEANNHQTNTPIYISNTSGGTSLETSGLLYFPNDILGSLDDEKLYVLSVRGGVDIDTNDDGILDTTPTQNSGSIRAILSGKRLKNENFKVNILTEVVYQLVKEQLSSENNTSKINAMMDVITQKLLTEDVSGDGIINYNDALWWLPTFDKDKLLKAYDTHYQPIVEKIYIDEAIYDEAYALVENLWHISLNPFDNSIDENTSIDTLVGKLSFDGLTGTVLSMKLSGEGSEYFRVESNGSIYTTSTFDYENKIAYIFQAKASNSVMESSEMNVTITINNIIEEVPTLVSQTNSRLYENITVGSQVATIKTNAETIDANTINSYQIVSGDDNGDFSIDDEGKVYLNKTLDPTVISRYILGIIATNDAGDSSVVTLVITTGEVFNPFLISKSVASDTKAGDALGSSVAVDGNYIVVGASGKNATYLFERQDDGSVLEIAQLTPSDDSSGWFGDAVAISGNTIVIGSYGDDSLGTDAGAVYLFEIQSDKSVVQRAKITSSDGEAYDNFGKSIAIDGNLIIIGAYRKGENGAAYLFEKQSDGSVLELSKLTALDGEVGGSFGWDVEIDGNLIVIGTFSLETVYLFEKHSDGITREVGQIIASDISEYDNFGIKIAIDGNFILVSNSKQAVYLFERLEDGTIVEHTKITASDTQSNDSFGYSTAIEGDIITVGAYNKEDKGAIYLFKKQADGSVSGILDIIAYDGQASDTFGMSVAMSGRLIVSGAKGEDNRGDQAGAAYIYDTDPMERIYIYSDKTLHMKIDEGISGGLKHIYAASPVGTLSYTLEGSDASHFSIEDGNLSLPLALDFEYPQDEDMNNSYHATIQIEDSYANIATIPVDLTIDDIYTTELSHYRLPSKDTVAIDGNLIVVGSSGEEAAYLLEKQIDGTMMMIQKLKAFNGEVNNLILVGTPYRDEGYTNTGAAYLYEKQSDGSITRVAKIVASDRTFNDYFAWHLSIEGNLIAIGAADAGEGGKVYFFEKQADNSVVEYGSIHSINTQSGDGFGHSVDMSGESIIVGAFNANAVYLFEKE
ncbi:MAG: cadherin domain-containing protein, partial [Campylobacterota bacterium]|nr:cadherin domain-containing protein [Campylobacterota bacterium]